MNILIISHERSLNKTKSIINSLHKKHNLSLVVEQEIKNSKNYTSSCNQIIIAPNYDLNVIKKKLSKCDKIICVSENLLPLQHLLEVFYSIENLSKKAGDILSNKFELHKFCLSNQLGNYRPTTIIPNDEKSFSLLNGPIIIKPDIGTGSNKFLPPELTNIEYKVWSNTTSLMNYLNLKGLKKTFFELNKKSIKTKRFNYKPCRMMAQEYINPSSAVYAPCGIFRKGKANVSFYLKTELVFTQVNSSFGEVGNSEVISIPPDEVPQDIVNHSKHYINTLLTQLNVKELFFAGPDFYPLSNKFYAIDFNPRLGHFFNLIDQANNGLLFEDTWNGKITRDYLQALWKVVNLNKNTITNTKWIELYSKYIPAEAGSFKLGDKLPRQPTLQSKPRSIQLLVSGQNSEYLYSKFNMIQSDIKFELEKKI